MKNDRSSGLLALRDLVDLVETPSSWASPRCPFRVTVPQKKTGYNIFYNWLTIPIYVINI